MKKEFMREDKLMQMDFNAAFPDTPSCIHEAVRLAKADIQRYERRKSMRRSFAVMAVAAAIMIAGISAVLFSQYGARNSDLITPPVLSGNEGEITDMEAAVFASKTDPYYHRDAECALAVDAVELPLITAVEFDKIPCPDCGAENK